MRLRVGTVMYGHFTIYGVGLDIYIQLTDALHFKVLSKEEPHPDNLVAMQYQ